MEKDHEDGCRDRVIGSDTRGNLELADLRGIVLCLLGCAIMVQTAVRIEIRNAEVGGVLPRRVPDGANPAWRKAPWTNERMWKKLRGPKTSDGSPVDRPLTAEEAVRMRREVNAAVRYDALRGLVSSWGLLQYPAVIAFLGYGGFAFVRHGAVARRAIGAVTFLVAGGCGFLMVNRAYLASLGW